jgi:hypothetical protein
MKLEKKKASDAGDLAIAYIKYLKAAPALNTRRIFEAWKEASGTDRYTIGQFFRDGTLYVTMNSAARVALQPHLEGIRLKMNELLKADTLFIKDDPTVGYVQKIVLK